MIDTRRLGEVVASNIEALCKFFFPAGKKENNEWKLGDSSGAEGNSLGVCLSADKAGVWHDRATGEKGSFVKLIQSSKNLSFPNAAQEISRCLGIDLETHQQDGYGCVDWAKCNKLSPDQEQQIADWRGYRLEFVRRLKAADLLRTYGANGDARWVFPIHVDGKVLASHSRPVTWKGKKVPWKVYPDNEHGGPGMRPLIIGNLKEAATVHLSESTWDMLALCDKLELHETDGFAALCTRGASNHKLASDLPDSIREVYLWPQNDDGGRTWLKNVLPRLPRQAIARIVSTPEQHEDLNAWIKAGASSDDLFRAISAAVISERPPVDETGQEENQKPKGRVLTGGSVVSFANTPIDHTQTLLGNRYLCIGGGMFIVAQSGVGKSSLSIQAAILWACGRFAFGIRPARPLRILIIQAEDDKGDVTEAAAMIRLLGLSESETALADANTWVEHLNTVCGDAFITELDGILEQWPADIVIINPFTAYLGDDEKDTKATARFLRNRLNPLLSNHKCAAVIIHHTPKTNFNSTDDYKPSDWMYRGSGNAGLTNWSRAYLVIDPADNQPGTYKFIAAKRGERIGWADEAGKPVFERYFRHCKTPGVIRWEEVEGEDIPRARSKYKSVDLDKLLALVPVIDPELKDNFHQRVAESLQVGINKIEAGMRQLHVEGKVFSRSMPNPNGGRSYAGWAKTRGSEEQNGEVG